MESLEKDGKGRGENEKESRRLKKKVRKVEEMWEKRERKERRRNVVIKEYKTVRGEAKSKIEEILKRVGAEVQIKELRKEMRTGRSRGTGLQSQVSLRTEREKREDKKERGG